MNDKLRRDSLITIISLAVVVALFTFVIYLPGLKTKQQLNQQIEEIQAEIIKIPEKVKHLEQLHRQLDQRKAFIKRLSRHIPAEKDTHQVLQRVALLANQSALTVSALNPGDPVVHETYLQQPFTLNVTGPYSGLLKFLNGLETENRLFSISNLVLSAENGGHRKHIKGTIELSVYALRDNQSDFSDFKENKAHPTLLSADNR